MRLRLLAFAAVLSSVAVAAHADSFLYTVDFNNSSIVSTATFTVPALLTSPTTITDATGTITVDGSTSEVASVEVDPTVGSCTINAGVACFVTYNSPGQYDVLNYFSDVDSPGVYPDAFGDGTVTITDIPTGSSVTPEPSSILLLGSGVLGMGGILRRRLFA